MVEDLRVGGDETVSLLHGDVVVELLHGELSNKLLLFVFLFYGKRKSFVTHLFQL